MTMMYDDDGHDCDPDDHLMIPLSYDMSLYSMIVMTSRSFGRLTEYHLHQLLFFISYNLHQLQLPHLASSSQFPFAIDAKGGEMFLWGSSPWGGACCQLSSMTKGEIIGQSESCKVCLSLMLSLMSIESLIEVLMSTKSLIVVLSLV